ncbi:S8 family serine peptidase [Salisediminibacterium halotolerans]|uniref:S8 family serine peptidase n=1 Tax=Salisediminibacterium halotolerans TaxID=517425 RepID=UPI000EB03835|nr:S8 family serine peptidase [Salisediminibacterium halotolerans]RLJ75527.1 minor extracellular serine protease Vpr [Actinophytocola xinjiangensis]RPE89380.1 minor extracellular serine protease Vpr [Salisediminibacterium halotolerans]TWG36140.1 minor extracellular serine protease Vpr [Salisediminibacterium halotolerans]GEL08142.1 minor extracellular protease vpr [Salisediminibacterium halotolerans]
MKRTLRTPLMYGLIAGLALAPVSAALADDTGPIADDPAELQVNLDELEDEEATVIVELEADAIRAAEQQGASQSREALEQERNEVIAELEESVDTFEVTREYDYLFSGFAVELNSADLEHVLDVAGIDAVYPNQEYEVTPEVEAEPLDDEVYSPEMMDSAPFIGANDAWDAGYTGDDVTVAVIDTGVDYTHPDLEHAFNEDMLGYDFVDDNADPQETTPDQGDPTNHGTHVAGTVAGNGLIQGTAPDASLLAYRVLGPGGSGTTEDVLAGIEQAVEDGADVLNLSLGAPVNDADYATSIALDVAMADNVVAVSSAGNSGPDNWTVGSPGTSRDAISVGATQLPYDTYTAELTTNGDAAYPSAEVMGFPSEEELLALNDGDYTFKDAGLGFAEDFEDRDFDGKIALISRGEIPFVDKAASARDAGAVGAVIYNNTDGEQPDVPGMPLPTVKMSQADGAEMLAELEAGNDTVNFDFAFDGTVDETVADFASRGPVMDTWMIKPDVSAPGVDIVSTIPTHDADNPHGYASLQGTSMSAPHVAGAAAVILQANPDWSEEDVKAALMNTAQTVYDPEGERYPHNTQGAGSIRLPDALETETLVTPGSHSFGTFTKEQGREVERQSFELKNTSDERQRYELEFDGPDGIKVQTSNNLNVQPGGTQDVNFGVQVDANGLESGYYSGTFTLSNNDESVEVPTILFVDEPDYPLMNNYNFDIVGSEYLGLVELPIGADEFSLRVRDAESGELISEEAEAENLDAGRHEFLWDFTVDGEALEPGSYALNVYAAKDDRETELPGPVLTLE